KENIALLFQDVVIMTYCISGLTKEESSMNIFVLEDDFKKQARIEKIITKLLEKHKIVPKKFQITGTTHPQHHSIE
ncbi:hypothetical protein ACJBXH_11975, partial [Streptococcus suis]